MFLFQVTVACLFKFSFKQSCQNHFYFHVDETMGKTKFKTMWQVNPLWLEPVKNDISSARCVASNSVLLITSGVGIIKMHEETPMHKKKVKVMDSTLVIFSTVNDDSFMFCSKKAR